MQYQAVIFDMDGTLVNSESIAHQVLSSHLAEYDYHIDPVSSCRRFAGRNMAECLSEIGVERGQPLPVKFEDEFRRRSAVAYATQLNAFDGVDRLLSGLTVPIAVASNGPHHKIAANLRISGLDHHFGDHIYSAYDVGHWKPAPGLFLAAASGLGCHANNCLVIEDTEFGLKAARAAGMDVMIFAPEDGQVDLPADADTFSHYDELFERLLGAH